MQRRFMPSVGNDPASWRAALPLTGAAPLSGDLNANGQIAPTDIDTLCRALRLGGDAFDLTADRRFDSADLVYLVEGVLQSHFGDVDLDGLFNSDDLVRIFQLGEYEDMIAGNSTWADGDWNCDGEFSSDDLVIAFQRGGYTSDTRVQPRAAASRQAIDRRWAGCALVIDLDCDVKQKMKAGIAGTAASDRGQD
jgi:hypothetical protein